MLLGLAEPCMRVVEAKRWVVRKKTLTILVDFSVAVSLGVTCTCRLDTRLYSKKLRACTYIRRRCGPRFLQGTRAFRFEGLAR